MQFFVGKLPPCGYLRDVMRHALLTVKNSTYYPKTKNCNEMKIVLFRLTIVIALISILSSCSKREDKNLGIKFIDDANLYSNNFKQRIINGTYRFPNGVAVLIVIIDSIPVSQIGFFANSIVENSSKWIESKKERKNSIFIIISKKPQLIQFRFGKNIILEAYKSGLAAGSKYRRYQEDFITKGYEIGLKEVLYNLTTEVPIALELSWLMKLQKPASQFIFYKMTDLAIPSDGAYTNIIFKPYVKVVKSLSIFSSPLFIVFINALLLLLIVKVGKVIIEKIFKKKKVSSILKTLWSIISSIFFSIPFWGSIVFLSSMRMEDSMFAEYMGIPILNFVKNSLWLSSQTHLWFAIVIGIIAFLFSFIHYMGSLEDTEEMDVGILQQCIENGFRIIFFCLFMPGAISLLFLFHLIMKFPFWIIEQSK